MDPTLSCVTTSLHCRYQSVPAPAPAPSIADHPAVKPWMCTHMYVHLSFNNYELSVAGFELKGIIIEAEADR